MKLYPYRVYPSSVFPEDIHEAYFQGLKQRLYPEIGLSEEFFATYTVAAPREYDQTWESLNKVLVKAYKGIVSDYFHSEHIRKIYRLSAEMEDLLLLLKDLPYEVGMFRPDFLVEEGSLQPKICEIGARYPVNGWMYTYYSMQVLEELNASHQLTTPLQNQQLHFPEKLASIWDPRSPIALILDKEKGTEVYGYLDLMVQRGYQIVKGTPADVHAAGDVVFVKGVPCTQFILELDRTELGAFDRNTLRRMTRHCLCVNDPRTLILVHDKRGLAVLDNDAIMSRILSEDEHQFLKAFLIPTYPLDDEMVKKEILKRSHDWIFKRNSGGKGIDMHLSQEMSDEALHRLLENHSGDYMAQRVVHQQKLATPDPSYFVGYIHYFNEISFGAGAFRGGLDRIINISAHRGKFYPTIYQSHQQPLHHG